MADSRIVDTVRKARTIAVMKALKQAISLCGSGAELGRRIGVERQTVASWLARGVVPAEMVLPIVRAVTGAVTPHDLRPDMYPDPDWLPPTLIEEA